MRILLADDDARVRSALHLLFQCTSHYVVVGESDAIEDLLARARDSEPDLILLDWDLVPDIDGSIVDTLHALDPRPLVIALSGRPESEAVALTAGADLFVSKAEPAEALLSTLESAAARSATRYL